MPPTVGSSRTRFENQNPKTMLSRSPSSVPADQTTSSPATPADATRDYRDNFATAEAEIQRSASTASSTASCYLEQADLFCGATLPVS